MKQDFLLKSCLNQEPSRSLPFLFLAIVLPSAVSSSMFEKRSVPISSRILNLSFLRNLGSAIKSSCSTEFSECSALRASSAGTNRTGG